ncbi:hypothetical protein [Streptomyces sp. R35]|uniref:Type II toxin-antitoxin system VapC family toxin n=1 Tax=Streptomyces sp. R35 TaxID=3238630 RepID=A0AB39SRK1_9ACTN
MENAELGHRDPRRPPLSRHRRPHPAGLGWSDVEFTAGQAGLVALFHVALVDTQIATSDSKYAYLRRRPVTAIRTGTIDPDAGASGLPQRPQHVRGVGGDDPHGAHRASYGPLRSHQPHRSRSDPHPP